MMFHCSRMYGYVFCSTIHIFHYDQLLEKFQKPKHNLQIDSYANDTNLFTLVDVINNQTLSRNVRCDFNK